VLQTATPTQQQAVVERAVGFDIYTQQSTNARRAGRVNVMTNGTLQQTGFGVYGYQVDDESTSSDPGYTSGLVPNFMWNQQINFNKTASGWYYSPLKYWPNETKKDSQTTPTSPAGMPNQGSQEYLDRLSFFAYAPFVKADASTGTTSLINTSLEAPLSDGIIAITNNAGVHTSYSSGKADPIVRYQLAKDPNNSVDLLWGVAPAGGLSYTNVSGQTTTVGEGMPLIDLTKPAVNTNMKFLFEHALARFGVKVVAAVDQVAAGGVLDYGNTKITIEKIEIAGEFGNSGWLNLNNKDAHVANWTIQHKANNGDIYSPVLTIEDGKGLAPHLIYDATKNTPSVHQQQTVTGVTTTLADAIKVSSTLSEPNGTYVKQVTTPAYSPTTPYFAAEGDNATSTPTYAAYVPKTGHYEASDDSVYFHKHTTNNAYTNNEAYTILKSKAGGRLDLANEIDNISLTYPTATVWENIYATGKTDFIKITSSNKATYKNRVAYRLVGNTLIPTGQDPEEGDFILTYGKNFKPVTLGTTASNYYNALPNYFMVIPTNNVTGYASDAKYRTLKVKITYYVSTTDANLADGIVYTKNEVEKDVVLPHLKNGSAYDLKLILGLTSVKIEADVTDWTTTNADVNLPQNTAE
jgi:hypothetical protein